MELAEGPTLADRISHGPIALDEALSIARQIAEALEAAHEKGIIHRDLKPANIKVTLEGTVKVLDFGLAKALEGEAVEADASQSPTLSLAATKAGVILGTAAYMSPEQARGLGVDKRCDIWSFGVVLFEMLAGKKLFAGETISDTLAAVLRADVDWSVLPQDTPASIRTLLRRCLTKDRKAAAARHRRRPHRHRGVFCRSRGRIGPGECSRFRISQEPSSASPGASRLFCLLRRWRWASFISARLPSKSPEMRFEINTPATSDPTSLAISPDGRFLVFVASAEGQQRLWLRPLDQVTAQPLAGTEGAQYPFWSPDSRSIGFFADGKLKRIDVAGGPPQVLASAPDGRGGAWNRDGVIVFAPSFASSVVSCSSLGGRAGGDHAAGSAASNKSLLSAVPARRPSPAVFCRGIRPGYLSCVARFSRNQAADCSGVAGGLCAARLFAVHAPGHSVCTTFRCGDGELAGDPVPVADSVASDLHPQDRRVFGIRNGSAGLPDRWRCQPPATGLVRSVRQGGRDTGGAGR